MTTSLYQLASPVTNPPFTIRPAAFNALIAAIIDVLLEQHIEATLIIKAPSEDAWRTDIERYQQQSVNSKIYLCRCLEDTQPYSGSREGKTVNDSKFSSLYLAAETQLKRESFLLVLSKQLCGVIIAHPSETSSSSMQVICTFERQTVQQVLDGIKSILTITDDTPEE